MSDSRTKNIKRNILFGAINKLIAMILPFVTRTIIIWKLGAEFLGLSSLFSSILHVLNMAELGFTSAVVFSLYKPIANRDNETVCALMAFYRKTYRIIGLIILILGLLVTPFITKIIKGNYPDSINIYYLYLLFLINTVISYWAYAYKSALLTADQREDIISKINTSISICSSILQISVLVIWANYYLFVFCMIIATVLTNISVAVITNKKYPNYFCKGEIDKILKKEIAKQVGGLAISRVSVTARNSFDSIFLSAFCGLVDVAIYSNYYVIFNGVLSCVTMLRTAFTASVGNCIATKSVDENYEDFKKINFYFLVITNFCVICLVCLYQPFMDLWMHKKLTASFSISILFGLYFFISSAGQVRSMYQASTGLWWEFKYFSIGEAIANLVLNAYLGYKFGMYGILTATLITVTFFSIICMAMKIFKLYFKRSAKEYFVELIKNFIIAAFSTTLVYFSCEQIEIDSLLLNFIARLALCAVLSIVILLSIYSCSRTYRNYFKELKKRI